MAVNGAALVNHPGLSPRYLSAMEERRMVQKYNQQKDVVIGILPRLKVPPQPNKYRPHQGRKEQGLA